MGLNACVTPQDYTNFKENMPRSILILPPTNETVEVEASNTYLTVATHPIAEKGFYVPPVVLVENFLKENGLASAAEMHQVPHKKLREVFGTDAVFYVNIEEWGNQFQVVTSETVVKATGRLVDLRTGKLLWKATQYASQSPSSNTGGGIVGLLVQAAVTQIVNETVDHTRTVARNSTFGTIHHQSNGFLDGPLKVKKSVRKSAH